MSEDNATEQNPSASQGDSASEGAQSAPETQEEGAAAKKAPAKRAPAKKAAAKAPAKKAPAKKAAAKAPAKTAAKKAAATADTATTGATKKSASKKPADVEPGQDGPAESSGESAEAATKPPARRTAKKAAAPDQATESAAATEVLFQTPATHTATRSRRRPEPKTDAVSETGAESTAEEADQGSKPKKSAPRVTATDSGEQSEAKRPRGDQKDVSTPDESDAEIETDTDTDSSSDTDGESGGDGTPRRRRRRGGRRRRKGGGGGGNSENGQDNNQSSDDDSEGEQDTNGRSGSNNSEQGSNSGPDDDGGEDGDGDGSTRRRRRRRREGDNGGGTGDDPQNTVTRVRKARSAEDEITAVAGSTRLEAKKQRRREGREAGRRRAPIVSEAEFLARREAVDRVMVIRQRGDLTQIGVLEDKVLVEHYVARESQASMIGNVYLGRVQNVLPSMEAAFIDIGKGRNAVLYAGEVNWSALGHKDGSPRKIESVLTSGQPVLVQVTKDPVGHKGARLTSQISMAGRFLVYVPDGTTSGISRKLPDTERHRLKTLLKDIVPDTAGVIVRTAAEGASEEELTRDVERLKARWEDVETKAKGKAPQLLYGEPDLTLKVVRDLFTEDFAKLAIQGDAAWETVEGYVSQVAPDLTERLEKFEADTDIFAAYRVEEQIAKALDRKVYLPSGGSLVIDRTEAMTVIDVNTGKFTGSGGNLEETVTKNNLEAAEEVVRQLRLRDIGGIIVVDYIDMVLESNRDLVLRRMVECLGRDRTRHQVAEVTSLGLVQMTRKRIGVGLVESFSHNCEHCQGRGVVIEDAPVEPKDVEDDRGRANRRRGSGNGSGNGSDRDGSAGGRGGRGSGQPTPKKATATPSPKDVAAMAKPPVEEPPAMVGEETSTQPDSDASSPDGSASEAASTSTPVETEPVAQADSPPAAPQVTTRTRSRRSASRPATTPAAETPAPEAPASEAPAVPAQAPEAAKAEPEAVEDSRSSTPSEPSAPAEPAAPTAPRVVTRTRRSASRPAGTPAAAPAPIVVASEPAAPQQADTDSAPVVAPEPPKVVTRTRGRTATRASGPPKTANVDEVAPDA
ncbi:hypothetical protein GCM10027020_17280 [Nocardioides salsibiostraticola]